MMTHCTVCGAAAREGAKFCTSCGARLVDTVSTAPAAADTATLPVADAEANGAADEAIDDQPAHEASWASTVTGSATGEVEGVPDDSEIPDAEPAASPEFAASWPGADDEPTETVPDEAARDESVAQPEEAWAAWSSTSDDPASSDECGSFATDADQDSDPPPFDQTQGDDDTTSIGRNRPSPFATDADQDARTDEDKPATTGSAGETSPDDPVAEASDDDHHGASQWESWAPVASGEAIVHASGSDVGVSVRRLLDDVAVQIDRLIDPAPIEARGVDADELADQLDRWGSVSTDADGLLEVVRSVRTSPRDVDALMRLADRAPDLELLVRHYQKITSGAGEWSRKLRHPEPAGGEDA